MIRLKNKPPTPVRVYVEEKAKAKGISMEELAHMVGLAQEETLYRKLEPQNTMKMTFEMYNQLIEILEVDEEELFRNLRIGR